MVSEKGDDHPLIELNGVTKVYHYKFSPPLPKRVCQNLGFCRHGASGRLQQGKPLATNKLQKLRRLLIK